MVKFMINKEGDLGQRKDCKKKSTIERHCKKLYVNIKSLKQIDFYKGTGSKNFPLKWF